MGAPELATSLHEALKLDAVDARTAGTIGFMPRILVQATLPHSRPRTHEFERVNGRYYACQEYRQRLARLGVKASMSRRGNCYDNAPMESLFSTLKIEWLRPCRFPTRSRARSSLFRYLELFYNRRRRHSSLGYRSPAQFEQEAA